MKFNVKQYHSQCNWVKCIFTCQLTNNYIFQHHRTFHSCRRRPDWRLFVLWYWVENLECDLCAFQNFSSFKKRNQSVQSTNSSENSTPGEKIKFKCQVCRVQFKTIEVCNYSDVKSVIGSRYIAFRKISILWLEITYHYHDSETAYVWLFTSNWFQHVLIYAYLAKSFLFLFTAFMYYCCVKLKKYLYCRVRLIMPFHHVCEELMQSVFRWLLPVNNCNC
jgi:hypothetical protein